MRFGAFVPQGWRLDLAGIPVEEQWDTMLGVARAIEAAGYESAWVYDHFHTVPQPTQEPTYEAWTLMAALAASTERVRLGQMCTANSYRMPSYLAKVAASVDVISGGRLEMGIGAGWYEHEYRGYGYEFPKPAVRIGQLAEGVEIMRRMWTEDEVSYSGRFYQLEDAICRPRPRQQPHIPIWVAGGGEQLTLRVAARHASYTNFGGGDLEVFRRKSGVLAEHCRREGTDFDAITRSGNFNIIIAPSEREVKEKLAWLRRHYGAYLADDKVEGYVASLTRVGLVGTPEQIAEQLAPWKEAGLGYVIAYCPDAAYTTESLDLLAQVGSAVSA
jgi:F420-dependent oxidoreductase-like protein